MIVSKPAGICYVCLEHRTFIDVGEGDYQCCFCGAGNQNPTHVELIDERIATATNTTIRPVSNVAGVDCPKTTGDMDPGNSCEVCPNYAKCFNAIMGALF
ncbi:MAG: hypothetical protein M8353_03305 [ANME-2 cluster archaeon]|nr:hypothetical protein [ANME-2 cluster archaeon]